MCDMPDRLIFDVRDAAKLAHEFERNGWTPADVDRIFGSDILKYLLPGIRQEAEITLVWHTVDLDADPWCEDGFCVAKHVRMGSFPWNPQNISLYVSDQQREERWVKGKDLRQSVICKKPFNANLLDFLIAHPRLFPEEWKGEQVHFWGTEYCAVRSANSLCVRCVRFERGQWKPGYHWFGMNWKESDSAAVLSTED